MNKNLANKVINTRHWGEKGKSKLVLKESVLVPARKAFLQVLKTSIVILIMWLLFIILLAALAVKENWNDAEMFNFLKNYLSLALNFLNLTRIVATVFSIILVLNFGYIKFINSNDWYLRYTRNQRLNMVRYASFVLSWAVSWLIFSSLLVPIFK